MQDIWGNISAFILKIFEISKSNIEKIFFRFTLKYLKHTVVAMFVTP